MEGKLGGGEPQSPLEIESGGYSRPGYSQLGERGEIEPDKRSLELVRLR